MTKQQKRQCVEHYIQLRWKKDEPLTADDRWELERLQAMACAQLGIKPEELQ